MSLPNACPFTAADLVREPLNLDGLLSRLRSSSAPAAKRWGTAKV
jgi:hypothetical protein